MNMARRQKKPCQLPHTPAIASSRQQEIMPPKKSKGAAAAASAAPMLGRPTNNVSIGIVGLPNVGKSTFFNVMCSMTVLAENYPFCTIDPTDARVAVPVRLRGKTNRESIPACASHELAVFRRFAGVGELPSFACMNVWLSWVCGVAESAGCSL
jgi:hypothetical protein